MAGIIDVHTHFFSRAFFEALAGQSPLPGTPAERLERLARETGLALPDPDPGRHLDRWVAEWDRHGVEHAVTFASLESEIDVVARVLPRAPGRVTGFALIDPCRPGAVERVRALLAQGLRGVLLFPAQHRYRLGGPEAAAVLEVLDAQDGFAVAHCGLWSVPLRDRLGLPRTHDLAFGNPLDLVPAANRFRRVRFVLPHFGAGLLREALMAGAQCENVYLDTSSSNAWMNTQETPLTLARVFERALGVFGPQRLLFGTDSSTFPRGWRHDLFAWQQSALAEIGLPASDRALLFGGNARRLLGLP